MVFLAISDAGGVNTKEELLDEERRMPLKAPGWC